MSGVPALFAFYAQRRWELRQAQVCRAGQIPARSLTSTV